MENTEERGQGGEKGGKKIVPYKEEHERREKESRNPDSFR